MTTFNSASLREIFPHYRAFLVDVFGVLRHSTGKYQQAPAVISAMQSRKKSVIFFSNTADVLPHKVADRLVAEGFEAREDQVVTSGMALTPVFVERGLIGKPIISVGNEDTAEYVRRAGGIVTSDWQEAEASALGYFLSDDNRRQFEAAVELTLRRGKACLLANTDYMIPVSEDRIGEGPGVIGELFKARTGVSPVLVGKPMPFMYKIAFQMLGDVPKREILAIGDSLYHDILGANDQGIDSLLVLSGLQGRLTPHRQLDEFMRRYNLYPTYLLPTLAF